jgi:hypothetical protein
MLLGSKLNALSAQKQCFGTLGAMLLHGKYKLVVFLCRFMFSCVFESPQSGLSQKSLITIKKRDRRGVCPSLLV